MSPGSTIEIADMDATIQQRHLRECLQSQDHAADAHELAASALEVAGAASDNSKQIWLSAACAAQETGAIEAQCARERLLGLLQIEGEAPELEPAAARPGGSHSVTPDEWWLRAIARLAVFSVRRHVGGRG